MECLKIVHNRGIDFFSTLWYSVLSTQRKRVLIQEEKCHCEERSDVAIPYLAAERPRDTSKWGIANQCAHWFAMTWE